MDGNSYNITEDKLKQLQQILPAAFTESRIDWLIITLGISLPLLYLASIVEIFITPKLVLFFF